MRSPDFSKTRREEGTQGMSRNQQWRKSSYSAGSGACVEVSESATEQMVRDSMNPENGILEFPWGNWSDFVNAIRK